jgi:ABC-type multidrug transport system ATPase subunit
MVIYAGPSGAGKSTLLDILAQRKTVGRLGGSVAYNGEELSPKNLQKLCSYVTQEVR